MARRTWYLGLGSNLGDRAAALRGAIDRLQRAGLQITRASQIYETAPVGPVPDQPLFLNAVIESRTALSPATLLALCQRVERQMGRRRRVAQGPREIDIDLLLAERLVRDGPDPVLPHPQLTRRAFVLRPLLDLAPALADPRDGQTLAGYLPSLEARQPLRRWGTFDGGCGR